VIEIRMANTARMIMEAVLEVKPGEKLLILTDTERPHSITKVLAVAAEIAQAQTVIITIAKPTGMSGIEPPETVAAAMNCADAIINQTSHSMTFTNAQRSAIANGARVCNIRNMSEDMMIRGGVSADYMEVKRISDMLVQVINSGERVHITTKEGTDLRFSIKGRNGFALCGFATEPGTFSGLPDGEAACAPLEGTAEGIIVNPYMMEDVGVVKNPISISFEKGLVVNVEGGQEARTLNEILEKTGVTGRNVAEFAFGTNPACRITGSSREDKKKLGTAHIAIGDNKSLGGNVECYMHMDITFLEPTISIDDKLIVKDGKVLML